MRRMITKQEWREINRRVTAMYQAMKPIFIKQLEDSQLAGAVVSVEKLNRPPRLELRVRFPAVHQGRAVTHPSQWPDDGPIYQNLTDDEYRIAGDIAMLALGCIDTEIGVRLYRDKRPAPGVVQYIIRPKNYARWAEETVP